MLKRNMSINRIGEHHEPLSALIKNRIRQRIIDGEFLPGERLVEHKLSEEMAVSRIPIREALRSLAAEGRSEEHTSELQSRGHLVCRLLLEQKKKHENYMH